MENIEYRPLLDGFILTFRGEKAYMKFVDYILNLEVKAGALAGVEIYQHENCYDIVFDQRALEQKTLHEYFESEREALIDRMLAQGSDEIWEGQKRKSKIQMQRLRQGINRQKESDKEIQGEGKDKS